MLADMINEVHSPLEPDVADEIKCINVALEVGGRIKRKKAKISSCTADILPLISMEVQNNVINVQMALRRQPMEKRKADEEPELEPPSKKKKQSTTNKKKKTLSVSR